MIREPTPEAVTYGEFVSNMKHRLCQAYRDVCNQLQAVQLKQKEYYDKDIEFSMSCRQPTVPF